MLSLDPLGSGERGAIVNTASVAAQDGQVGQAAYTGVEGRHHRPHPGGGARPVQRRDPLQHHPARHHEHPDDGPRPAVDEGRPGRPGAVPKRLGEAPEFASMALELITNGYMNGENIRLDGAIRMAPR